MNNNPNALIYFQNGYSKAVIQNYQGAIADFEKAMEYGYEKPEELYINIASCHNAIAHGILQSNGSKFEDTVGASRDRVILESQQAYNSIIKALEFKYLNDTELMQCNLMAGITSFRINMYRRTAKDLPDTLNYLKKAVELGSQEAIPLLMELTRIMQEESL